MTRPAATGSGHERGFALPIVLFTLALLALLVATVAVGGRGAAELADNLREAAIAEAAADGAVAAAGFHLLDASRLHWPADGTVRRIVVGGVPVAVRITSEAGKVNPNLADPALLAALLQAVGADPGRAGAVAAAIVAWRAPTPAAAAAYAAAGRDYAPPGAKFQSLDELGLVLGMTPGLLARLRPHLSLARDRPPDPAAADPVVTAALAAVGGQVVPSASTRPDESLVRVVAVALGPGRARFVRAAVLQVAPSRPAAPLRILQWRAPPLDTLSPAFGAAGQL